jgi:4-hydroxybenzoate polyprenyl transferase
MKIFDFARLIRLNQPTGIWLLFIPCLLGIALCLKIYHLDFNYSIVKIIGYFFLGSILMRSAGCIINDLLDIKFDKKVLRTKNRPLASNKISKTQAITLLAILLSLGFLILIQFNFSTILSGIFSLFLIFTYPLMKRFFNLPQFYLGITFNFGILMTNLAIIEKIHPSIFLLYFACILWTLIYDTIYGFQDIEDDLRIGVKSSAITINKFFKNPKIILYILNFLIILSLFLIGFIHSFNLIYFTIILFSAIFSFTKISFCDLKNPHNCLSFFKQNVFFGCLILIAIISG